MGVDRYNRPGAQWRKSRSSSASTLGPQPCRCVMIGRRGDMSSRVWTVGGRRDKVVGYGSVTGAHTLY